MLKIRKNISFETLKEYGFVKVDSYLFNRYLYVNRCKTIQNRIYVYQDLHIAFGNINKTVLDTLYDLIKDNIIEKVDEK